MKTLNAVRDFMIEHAESIWCILGAVVWLALWTGPMATFSEKSIVILGFVPMNPNHQELMVGIVWIAKVVVSWVLGEFAITILYIAIIASLPKDLISSDRLKVTAIAIVAFVPWILWITIF